MINFREMPRMLSDARALIVGVVLVLGAIGFWYYFGSPLTGFVSATVIDEDGAIRAVRISLDSNDVSGFPFLSNLNAATIASIPSPTLDKSVFITYERGQSRVLSIANPDGTNAVAITEGEIEDPSWSPDGSSIAFARLDSQAEYGIPEEWTVFRAVRNGDVLSVGKGYRPFPSPHQRTYALSSEGIVLLAYNDLEPSLVVASPKPVPLSTPFSVSADGMRLAWVAPADGSLQVYEDINGYLVPLLLLPDSKAQSLVFSPTGKHILVASHSGVFTTIELITISSGRTKVVSTFPGFMKLHTWRYEK